MRSELDTEATAALQKINEPKRRWLGNVPVLNLVRLRLDGENADFRRRLKLSIAELHESSAKALNQVILKVSDKIASMLAEHDVEISAILESYRSKFQDPAVDGYITPAASLLATVSPRVRFGDPLSPEHGDPAESARSLLASLAPPLSS